MAQQPNPASDHYAWKFNEENSGGPPRKGRESGGMVGGLGAWVVVAIVVALVVKYVLVVVGLVAGGGLLLLALTFRRRSREYSSRAESSERDATRADRYQVASLVCVALGVVVVAGGVVAYIDSRDREGSASEVVSSGADGSQPVPVPIQTGAAGSDVRVVAVPGACDIWLEDDCSAIVAGYTSFVEGFWSCVREPSGCDVTRLSAPGSHRDFLQGFVDDLAGRGVKASSDFAVGHAVIQQVASINPSGCDGSRCATLYVCWWNTSVVEGAASDESEPYQPVAVDYVTTMVNDAGTWIVEDDSTARQSNDAADCPLP